MWRSVCGVIPNYIATCSSFTCRVQKVVDDSALPAANKSVLEDLGPARDTTTRAVPNVKTGEHQSIKDSGFRNTLMLSSKLQHQVNQNDFCTFCPECQRDPHYHHHRHNNHRGLSQALPQSSKNLNSDPFTSHEGEDAASIIDSFDTLSVSNSHHPVVASHSAVAIPRSCRQEATNSVTYFDDTTVDDLAGYLDEIMFLPKPMSEMAELMYT